ncbi:DUF5707 domain-containing protein [Streptomyces prasinus]|uniref:DUF5707 domain-containing protein n=1 Tax=Streptomyces prasinus TaxID=67345 RepID=UPI0036A5B0E9
MRVQADSITTGGYTMSKRVLIGSFVGALVIGGAAAGFAMASGPTKPSLENNSARYTAPSGDGAGSFSFTADVSDDSGVKSLHVLPWPTEWKLDPPSAEPSRLRVRGL